MVQQQKVIKMKQYLHHFIFEFELRIEVACSSFNSSKRGNDDDVGALMLCVNNESANPRRHAMYTYPSSKWNPIP